MFLGLANVLTSIRRNFIPWIKDGLKLHYFFRQNSDLKITHASTGSTSFDGDDYINCGNSSDFPDDPDGEEFTITAWFKGAVGSDGTIFSKADDSNRAIQAYTHTDDTLYANIGGTQISSGKVVADGTWHHIALRSFNDGGTYKGELYVDGSFTVVGTTGTTTATDRDFLIGARRDADNTDTGYLITDSSIANVGIWSRALSASEIQGIMYKKYADLGSVDKASLVSWWGLDVDYTDSHGSNDGTNSGSTLTNSVYGDNAPQIPRILDVAQPKQAVQLADGSTSFDGTNDSINLGNDSSLQLGDEDTTYALWIKTSDVGNYIIAKRDGSNGAQSVFLDGAGKLQFLAGMTGQDVSTTALNDNVWHHIAVVYDKSATSVFYYLDGSLDGSDTSVTAGSHDDNSDLYLGQREADANYLEADIANVGIWSGTLTQTQVQELMFSSYSTMSADLKTNLVSWYDLGDTSLGSNLVTSWANRGAVPYETFTSSGANITNAINTTTSAQTHAEVNLTVGKLYKIVVDLTLDSGTAPFVGFQDAVGGSAGSVEAQLLSAGENTITTVAVANDNFLMINNNATTTEFSAVVTLKEVLATDSQGSNDGSIYGATTTTGYTSSPHGVVDPINYGTLKSGTALSFDGTNDKVVIGDVGNIKTVSFWVNADTATEQIIDLDGTQYITVSSNTLTLSGTWSSSIIYIDGAVSTTLSNDQWHHVAVTVTANIDADSVDFGIIGSDYGDITLSNVTMFDTTLTSSQIQELYLNPEQILPTGVSSSNLKLYLPMNEGDGTYTYDGSGNQNHGTITGATWDTANTDIAQVGLVRQNSPMVFDGSDDYVSLGTPYSYTNNTFSAWIKPEANSSADRRIIDTTDANDDGVLLYVRGDSDKIQYAVNGSGLQSASTYNGQWVHIVGTYDGSTQKLYINGSLDQSTSTSQTISTTTNAIIGARSFTSQTTPFKGLINEVAIWDVALDADAVTALYNSGTPLDATEDSGNYDNSGDLQGYWRNDNDTTWTDRTPLGAYGSELVTNGDFSSDSGWTKETFAITGGVAVASSEVNSTQIYQSISQTSGKSYEATFTISGYSAGGIKVLYDSTLTSGTTFNSNGTHTVVVQPVTGGSRNFGFRCVGTTTLNIDNVSLKRYRGGNDGTASGSPDSIVLTEGLTSGRDSQGFYLTDTTENCLTLNGAEYVEIPDSEVLSFGDGTDDRPFSIEAWIKCDDATDFWIAQKGLYADNTNEWNVFITNTDKFGLQLYDESASAFPYRRMNSNFTENIWQHIAVTYDGRGSTDAMNGVLLYVNGSVTSSDTIGNESGYVAMENLSDSVYIGSTTASFAKGKIDDVRIYSQELSASEVLKNYNAGKSKHS